jgi:hypothetical protein
LSSVWLCWTLVNMIHIAVKNTIKIISKMIALMFLFTQKWLLYPPKSLLGCFAGLEHQTGWWQLLAQSDCMTWWQLPWLMTPIAWLLHRIRASNCQMKTFGTKWLHVKTYWWPAVIRESWQCPTCRQWRPGDDPLSNEWRPDEDQLVITEDPVTIHLVISDDLMMIYLSSV